MIINLNFHATSVRYKLVQEKIKKILRKGNYNICDMIKQNGSDRYNNNVTESVSITLGHICWKQSKRQSTGFIIHWHLPMFTPLLLSLNAKRLKRRQQLTFLKKSLVWTGRDSNPRPPDHAAKAITTRPHDRSSHLLGWSSISISRNICGVQTCTGKSRRYCEVETAIYVTW